jgi:hypothetical protein
MAVQASPVSKMTRYVTQAVEHLSSKCNALSPNPSTALPPPKKLATPYLKKNKLDMLVPVSPATQEVEVGRSQSEASPG